MSNDLDLYNKILFMGLRPWTNRDTAEAKFKELMQGISKENFSFQPLYEVTFIKALSAKRKFYFALIENEATRYLNNINCNIADAINDKERKYWVHDTLTKKLSQKLKETEKVIQNHEYFLADLSPSLKSDKNDETYIIQFLKFQLIRLYLEIQNAYKTYLKEEEMSEEELHLKYFSEQAPTKAIIIEASKLNLPPPASQVKQEPEPVANFTPKEFDFRPAAKGIIPYKKIIKEPNRFSRFEEELFINDLIDVNYNFRNEHGNIQIMAATFHTLIKKNYFHSRKFPENKEIGHLEIRRFLDHRYNSKTDKQFRNWANTPNELADFVELRRWLDKLPLS